MRNLGSELTDLATRGATLVSGPAIGSVFAGGVVKTRRNLPDLCASPSSWGFDVEGDYPRRREPFFHIDNWTTSFFSGMGVLSYLYTRDRWFLEQLSRLQPFYRDKVGIHGKQTMHDLGFLYSLYAVALFQMTGEEWYRELALQGARVLAARFVEKGRYLRAWGEVDDLQGDYAGLAIIDSLMNLPLLYWAAEESGQERYRELAMEHSETALRCFLRPDGSTYHAYRFDLETGRPLRGDNYGGLAVDSHWARGSAWAMYGFAMGYRYTGVTAYRDASLRISECFASHLDERVVPVWDFRARGQDAAVRDSSAAAIAICAIQELEKGEYAPAALSESKDRLLTALCSAEFLDPSPASRALLQKGQVSAGPGRARHARTSWGDYFFFQALGHELGLPVTWW
ncbi:glycoside hydrolase family 88 protein [Roseibacillus ishigakijimensis]|uniref:Glycoside hydrolase family 88 protein n=1 Tax=Roseibacillus ishigakijimensis TaxID=454146 RepID=A0A934VHU7_9BACT|nr:glycoside hydrolase family 88 protein [Roseibacillus ishigakijimensis]MBK1834363.1 glycoside hydrolase family 88 protein [Roseibacillus ishigakijimensis]